MTEMTAFSMRLKEDLEATAGVQVGDGRATFGGVVVPQAVVDVEAAQEQQPTALPKKNGPKRKRKYRAPSTPSTSSQNATPPG
jgi:hypothetical protein